MAEQDEQPTGASVVMVGGGLMLPVFLLLRHIGRADLGLPACIYVGMIICAIWMRWELRKRWWFWATITFVLLLHVPVVLFVPLPHMTLNRITLLPIGVADFLIIMGAVRLVEKFLIKPTTDDEED